MNKLFTKIAALSVGLAMAIGVGVAVGERQNNKTAKATSGVNATYELVTSNLSNWAGKYLIYNSTNSKLWDASSAISKDGTYISNVTPSDNTITADTSYEWTIEAVTGGYSICSQLASNPYISGANKGVSTGSSAVAHTISYSNGVFTVNDGTYNLRVNSGYFRYYTGTTGASIQLFKKVNTSDYIADSLTISPSTSLNVEEDDAILTNGYTISGSKNGGVAAALSSSDYTFQGCGTGTGSTFNVLSTTKYKAGATRIQWKANYPTTAGGSTYAYVGISVTVKVEQCEYVKVTNANNLVAGHRYLLVEEVANSNKYYAMGDVSSNLGVAEEVTLDTTNNKIASKANKGNATEYILGGESGAWTLYGSGVYLSYSGSSNNILTSETATTNNQKWTIDFSAGEIVNKASTGRYIQFNYNNGSPRFACYANTQTDVFLYEKIALEPALSLSDTLEGYIGETDKSLTVTAQNYVPDTFVWTSSNENAVTVSGNTATAALTFIAAGESNVKVVASKGNISVEKTCVVTVKAAPTAVVVKVNNQPIDSSYVMEQWEAGYKQPIISVSPAEANQNVTLTVHSETVSGAFTITNGRINYVKPATGVIRIASYAKPSVYFDLKVKCNEDTYTAGTLSYSGTPVTQSYGAAFDATGLTFSIAKASGSKTINKNDLTFTPETMAFDTTTVTATHAASGQTLEIPVSVAQPISVAEALEIIDALDSGAQTTQNYTVVGLVSNANTVSNKSQTYFLSDDGTRTDELQIYKGKWIDGADMDSSHYFDPGDKAVVNGKLYKYNDGSKDIAEMASGSVVIKATYYYSTIKDWIDDNLHFDDYDGSENKGYCNDSEHNYYLNAKIALADLGQYKIAEFAANEEEDFADAYDRYTTWAEICGDGSPFDGLKYIDSAIIVGQKEASEISPTIAIIAISAAALIATGAYFFIRKKKED